ncbi:putative peptidylprolyl isomerase [Helianthus anomalus]
MKKKPLVFMDLSIFKRPPDRLVIELFYDDVPKTAENFRALCTGEKGIGKDTQKLLHYKGTKFFYFSDCAALGGDFENNDGTGGESIYGGTFQAERSPWRRSGPGILMTLSQRAPDATGSQFVLCYRHSTDLEGDNTVFGRVIKGMDTVLELEMMGRGTSVEIVDCGEVSGDYVPESESYKPSPLAAWRQKREEMATAFLHKFLSRKVIDREATSEKPSSNPDEMSESHESNAEKSELKPPAEGLTNSSSYPHHRNMNKEQELAEAGRFVRRFFELLDTNPAELTSMFDNESSVFIYGRENGTTAGVVGIVGKLTALSSKGCTHKVTTMDSLLCEREDRGILVSVNGRLKVNGFDHDLVFSQMFFLKTKGQSFYVRTGVYRLKYLLERVRIQGF